MEDPAAKYRQIFSISSEQEFNEFALEIFRFQFARNHIYRQYCELIKCESGSIRHYSNIPFLPIEFFKNHRISSTPGKAELEFKSSGTTFSAPSTHHVLRKEIYMESLLKGFELFYGKPEEYCILALLPSYLERDNSSLVFMVNELIKRSGDRNSGFYLHNLEELHLQLRKQKEKPSKTLLIGVTFALLELAEKYPISFPDLIMMETGGMKGRRKEMIREELHAFLQKAFGLDGVHSEYGMTELLSQAYAVKDGFFRTPPWMKVLVRDVNDPLSLETRDRSGGINIIDLANLHSCSFIATQDLGRRHADGSFEVLGRFDNSDVRGCNLMVG
ncbi:MAG: acyl transferase [Bacteroidota bacterium]|nr:acyl transferase [Bacteroidota bacterium]